MDAAAQMAALRAFEQANDRAATPAERKLLRDLAERYDLVAENAAAANAEVPSSGWGWLEAAVWEAVEAGSAFVAPRRLREILQRWERDGFPGTNAAGASGQQAPVEPLATWEPAARLAEPAATAEPVNFLIAEVGLSSRQVWAAVMDELAQRGSVSRADLETWLRPASLIGRDDETLLIGAPNAVARDRIATRLLSALREAIVATIGVDVEIAVVSGNDWEERRAAGA
jgi:DnaA-like protein